MDVLKSHTATPDALKGSALAIGNFDGVHRGHQAVLAAARDISLSQGRTCGAMTFEPHPRQFFQPDVPLFRLAPEPLKLRLLDACGLDFAVVLEFDAALASLSAQAFVEQVLVDGLGVAHVITGSDFHFGKGRAGTPAVLRDLGVQNGFGVTQVEPQGDGRDVFSSTDARQALRAGDPQRAAEILGYRWRVAGEVVGGHKRGRWLEFPTANMVVPPGFDLHHGIYAVRVWVGSERYGGAGYLGTRPSFDDGDPVIETFLFDFSGDLYGREIELEFVAFLRGDEKFDDADALKEQMTKDCAEAQRILNGLESDDPFAPGLLGGARDG